MNKIVFLMYQVVMGWKSGQPHKMVKHTQTIYRQIADQFFECV